MFHFDDNDIKVSAFAENFDQLTLLLLRFIFNTFYFNSVEKQKFPITFSTHYKMIYRPNMMWIQFIFLKLHDQLKINKQTIIFSTRQQIFSCVKKLVLDLLRYDWINVVEGWRNLPKLVRLIGSRNTSFHFSSISYH